VLLSQMLPLLSNFLYCKYTIMADGWMYHKYTIMADGWMDGWMDVPYIKEEEKVFYLFPLIL
jgi:hypothetical protein